MTSFSVGYCVTWLLVCRFVLMVDTCIDFVMCVVNCYFNSVAWYICVYVVRIFCCVLFAYVAFGGFDLTCLFALLVWCVLALNCCCLAFCICFGVWFVVLCFALILDVGCL